MVLEGRWHLVPTRLSLATRGQGIYLKPPHSAQPAGTQEGSFKGIIHSHNTRSLQQSNCLLQSVTAFPPSCISTGPSQLRAGTQWLSSDSKSSSDKGLQVTLKTTAICTVHAGPAVAPVPTHPNPDTNLLG